MRSQRAVTVGVPYRLLSFLAAHGRLVLAVGIFVGIAWPWLAGVMAPLLAFSVFVLLITSLSRVEWGAVLQYGRRPGHAVLALVWLMAVAPAAMLGLLSLTPLPEGMVTAVVLMTAAPPIMVAVAFALLLRLDAALAVIPTLTATLLTPLTLPPMALFLLDLELDISAGAFMLRLGLLAGGALLAALLLRRILGREKLARHAPHIDGVSVLMMLVFAIAVMDGVQAVLIERPGYVLLATAAGFAANLGLQLTGALLFRWMGLRSALTVGLLSGNRNMGLILAALGGSASFDVALFFAAAQIPMYVLPAVVNPLYRRLMRG